MQHAIVSWILLCLVGQEVFGARILGLFPYPGRSHVTITMPIMHALAEKGHDVTLFVPFPTEFKATNYKEIVYSNPNGHMELNNHGGVVELFKQGLVMKQMIIFAMSVGFTESALNTTEARELLDADVKYDVIVMENFYNDAFLVFAHKFNAPVVLISSFGTSELNRYFGNPAPYSYVPTDYLGYGDRMTFFERVQNTLSNIFLDIVWKYMHIPKHQQLAEEYLSYPGMTIPPLKEIAKKHIDFLLINSHQAFSTPRPYMPNMKEIGGVHIRSTKPLPKDLQRYMDSSKNGVILMSFGSGLYSTQMLDHMIKALKAAFGRVPYDVLWKWEADEMVDKPENVRIEKWVPQNDLLAHPNLKLFITHGGMSSIMETVYHEVPIVGIPIFGDQFRNVKFAEIKGYAEWIDFKTMTEDDVYEAITKVLGDPKYQENVKKVSSYWKDEIVHPLHQSVHWIEYVANNGGAKHLKAAVLDQSFIEYFLIDVVFAILLLMFLVYFTISRTIRLLCKKSRPKKTTKKTN